MENPYNSMLWNAWEKVLPVLPYFIGILAFIFAFQVLDAKFGGKKRRGWRGSSRWDRGKVHQFRPRHDALPGILQARS